MGHEYWLHSPELTGRRRYRTGIFGKKILQVEEKFTIHSWDTYPYYEPCPSDGTEKIIWRDWNIKDEVFDAL